MKKTGIVGIAIVVILVIIWAISVWAGQNTATTKVKLNCDRACHKVGNRGWTFLGAGLKNIFSTEENCVSACQTKFGK